MFDGAVSRPAAALRAGLLGCYQVVRRTEGGHGVSLIVHGGTGR